MKIAIESTSKKVDIETPSGARVPARIWEGETESGIEIVCLVTRLSPDLPLDSELLEEFQHELTETVAPRLPLSLELPLRIIL